MLAFLLTAPALGLYAGVGLRPAVRQPDVHMMARRIEFGHDARQHLVNGVDKVASAVKVSDCASCSGRYWHVPHPSLLAMQIYYDVLPHIFFPADFDKLVGVRFYSNCIVSP